MALKFCASVAKGLKLKFRRFWGQILMLVEVTGEKLVGGIFARTLPSPSHQEIQNFHSTLDLIFYICCFVMIFLQFSMTSISYDLIKQNICQLSLSLFSLKDIEIIYENQMFYCFGIHSYHENKIHSV